jgi:dCMP deaminase
MQLSREATSWDKRWMSMCNLVASWSKDRSRQTGAVIVDYNNTEISTGWNGFPRGVDDNRADRHTRPAKYAWTEHAERNAIYKAASLGRATRGCTMYLPWFPCVDCARAIIQSGITKVVCVEPDWMDPIWGKDFLVVEEMLEESGVVTVFLLGYEAPVAKGLV